MKVNLEIDTEKPNDLEQAQTVIDNLMVEDDDSNDYTEEGTKDSDKEIEEDMDLDDLPGDDE